MSGHKKPRLATKSLDSHTHLKCQICATRVDACEELQVLTDPRLTAMYDTSGQSSGTAADERPQHRINNFIIHDSGRRLCYLDHKPIDQLFLCGYVEPIVSDGHHSSDPIVTQMIGPLQEWWFAGFDGGSELVIGCESEFASYVLSKPNPQFKPLFDKYSPNMYLTKLVIESLLSTPDSSYDDLVVDLEDKLQDFTEELLLQSAPFITEQIKSFDSAAEEDEVKLYDTPAIQTLVQMSGVDKQCKSQLKTVSHIRPIARVDARRAINSDTLTCSTPLVTDFFDHIFKDVIECDLQSNALNDKQLKSHDLRPDIKSSMNISLNPKVVWIEEAVHEDCYTTTLYYSAVKVDQQKYCLGDFAYVQEEDKSSRLARIMFMFSTSDEHKLCHINYFCLGNETILGQTSPHSLVFMTNECKNISIEKLIQKSDVTLTNELNLSSNHLKCDQYFCNKLYHKKSGRFEDLPQEVFDVKIKCFNCWDKNRIKKHKIPHLVNELTLESPIDSNIRKYEKVMFNSETYSVGDCALFTSDSFDFNDDISQQISATNACDEDYDQRLYPEKYRKAFTDYVKGLNNDLPKTLNIGFINQIYKQNDDCVEDIKLLVNMFYRPQHVYEDYDQFLQSDLNVLFYNNKQTIVSLNTVCGKCQVIYSPQSLKTDFYIQTKLFYFNQSFDWDTKSFIQPNNQIISQFSHNLSHQQLDNSHKLNVLDLFSGCGGLSYGFHKLGLVSKLWAIEKDESAINSYKTNFKSSHVFQEDVNHFLDLLLKGVKCDQNGQIYPQKGDIDLILGGPPCQGFSGMNRFSWCNYSRFKNSLIVSFLSFIDYYRPKYLVFENVRNFALFKNSMILQLMMSCLVQMGYQCQFAILQSGSYGLPQTRRRTIIIGSQTGTRLPLYPQPTHAFSKRQCQLTVTVDNRKYMATNCKHLVQFRALTVADAINDLPELAEDYATDKVRPYKSSHGISHYQTIMRQNVIQNNVSEHLCRQMSLLCRLRITHIPHRSDSDWRDLPNISQTLSDQTVVPKLQYLYQDVKNGRSKSGDFRGVCQCAQGLNCNAKDIDIKQKNTLIPWCLVHTANRQYQWSGLYGRLALNGYFPTTVTNPQPISKQGRVLHPNQNRIISIRESARSQAFPDNFVFCGSVVDKYRQIGNAVPIPLSIALAKQFYSAINSNVTQT